MQGKQSIYDRTIGVKAKKNNEDHSDFSSSFVCRLIHQSNKTLFTSLIRHVCTSLVSLHQVVRVQAVLILLMTREELLGQIKIEFRSINNLLISI